MNKTITFFIMILSLLSSCSFVVADYGGVTLSSWTDNPPTIDGVMAPGEWDKADFSEFATDHEPPVNGTIYVMNDAENLYLFVIFDYISGMGSFTIKFDNDNDEVEWEPDDDGLSFGWHPPPNGFQDLHFSAWGSDASQDGAGADSSDANYRYVEFSHPLNSGDPEDFSLGLGDTVGFQLCVSFESSGYWPPQAQTTNDIIIAAPPEHPVGGELYPFSQLPSILITLAIVASIVLSYRVYGENHKLFSTR